MGLIAAVFFVFLSFPVFAEETLVLRAADTPAECVTSLDYYKASEKDAATFILRGGYSRDNDDPVEGHYETAVIDLELAGKRLPDGRTCLHLVSTPILSTERHNAAGWAANFYLRPMAVSHFFEGKWALFAPAKSGVGLWVVPFTTPPYALAGKAGKLDRPAVETTGIRSVAFLGAFTDGHYNGRAYLQTEGRGFTNVDDSDYNTVRHVIEWTVSLDKGLPVNVVKPLYAQADPTGPKYIRFQNEVRLVTPTWNGSILASGDRKFHAVSLMWKDVLTVMEKDREVKYGKYDLMPVIQDAIKADPLARLEEPIGRFTKKR